MSIAMACGQRVCIPIREKNCTGKIAYLGPVQGGAERWIGVVLDMPNGYCDGTVDGISYFDATANAGLLLPERATTTKAMVNFIERPRGELGERILVPHLLVGGTIRYVGPVHWSKISHVGIVLDKPVGDTDGEVCGMRYFACGPKEGWMQSTASLKCKGNWMRATEAQKKAAAKVGERVGKKAATETQKKAAAKVGERVGKKAATETQKKVAKIIGKKSATETQKSVAQLIGKKAATDTQKENAKAIGLKPATDTQRTTAAKVGEQIGKKAATETQKKVAKVIGKKAATETQRKAAAKVGAQIGKKAATETQRAVAKITGKKAATETQREVAAKVRKDAAKVKKTVAAQNRKRYRV